MKRSLCICSGFVSVLEVSSGPAQSSWHQGWVEAKSSTDQTKIHLVQVGVLPFIQLSAVHPNQDILLQQQLWLLPETITPEADTPLRRLLSWC